jgi:hypothetical protein
MFFSKVVVIKERFDLSELEISPINVRRPAVTFMAGVTLSYSRILRVIGQDLEPLGVNSFELEKWGDDFSVLMNQSDAGRELPTRRTVFEKFMQKILGHSDSPKETPRRYFSSGEVLLADIERQSKRGIFNSPSDLRDLSLELRGLGDYLDRKAAREFTISWAAAPNSIKVSYDQKKESFTVRDLYDFGIHMYMKRSDRPRTD